jgi:hypothetical protein
MHYIFSLFQQCTGQRFLGKFRVSKAFGILNLNPLEFLRHLLPFLRYTVDENLTKEFNSAQPKSKIFKIYM